MTILLGDESIFIMTDILNLKISVPKKWQVAVAGGRKKGKVGAGGRR